MNRKEYVENSLEISEERRELSTEVQRLYDKYYETHEKCYRDELVNQACELATSAVRGELFKTGCYSADNEKEAMQAGSVGLLEFIRKNANNGETENKHYENIGGLVVTVYRKRTIDFIRKELTNRNHTVDKPNDESENNRPDQIETLIDKDGDVEKNFDKKFKQKTVFGLITIYSKSLMNYDTFFPRSLAYCFSRILYHIDSRAYNKTASSPDWALDRMKGNTVDALSEDSQKRMTYYFGNDMIWCDKLVSQLSDEVDGEILGEIDYTSKYGKDKISDWTESMHKTIIRLASKALRKDNELFESAKTFITDEKSPLYGFIDGKVRTRRKTKGEMSR